MGSRGAPPTARRRPTLAVLMALLLAPSLMVVLVGPSAGSFLVPAPPADEYINVTASSSLVFQPSTFPVVPGALVHLNVTQGSTFEHTFTLSSLANFTVPSTYSLSQLYAFLQAHPPLVNLSLGTVAGTVYQAMFTAPATGTYEYLCIEHYTAGMVGTMTSAPPGSGTSPASSGVSPVEIAVGAVVVVAVISAVAVALRRRRRAGPPGEDIFHP